MSDQKPKYESDYTYLEEMLFEGDKGLSVILFGYPAVEVAKPDPDYKTFPEDYRAFEVRADGGLTRRFSVRDYPTAGAALEAARLYMEGVTVGASWVRGLARLMQPPTETERTRALMKRLRFKDFED